MGPQQSTRVSFKGLKGVGMGWHSLKVVLQALVMGPLFYAPSHIGYVTSIQGFQIRGPYYGPIVWIVETRELAEPLQFVEYSEKPSAA